MACHSRTSDPFELKFHSQLALDRLKASQKFQWNRIRTLVLGAIRVMCARDNLVSVAPMLIHWKAQLQAIPMLRSGSAQPNVWPF